MKRIVLACLFAFALVTTSALAEELTGMVTCSKCKHTDESAANCAKTCIKNGVAPIFISSADSKVYKIANPKKVVDNVGQKVTVDAKVKGDTLTVNKITPAAKS